MTNQLPIILSILLPFYLGPRVSKGGAGFSIKASRRVWMGMGNIGNFQLEECFDRLLKNALKVLPQEAGSGIACILWSDKRGVRSSVWYTPHFPYLFPISILPSAFSHLRKRPAEIRQHTLFWVGLNRYMLPPVLSLPTCTHRSHLENGVG